MWAVFRYHSVMRGPELNLQRHGEKRSAWFVYSVSSLTVHGFLVCSLLLAAKFQAAMRPPPTHAPDDKLPRDSKREEDLMTVDLESAAAFVPSPTPEAPAHEEESVPRTPQLRALEAAPLAFPKAHSSRAGERAAEGNGLSPGTQVPELTSADGTDSGGRAAPQEPEPAQRLMSLDQLGIGDTNRLATLTPRSEGAPRRKGRRARTVAEAEAALQSNIADSITRLDQYHGLGPEGPVLVELVNLARTETTPPNSHARFEFTTDAEGRLLRVKLLQSSSDPQPWQRIAQTILERLRGQKLRLAKTGRGAIFTVKVEARAALPSGADPGFGVNLLGIPLKKGAGPRSSRIDILNLNPMAITDPSLGSFGAIVSLRGDLVDIGARVTKQTHAHLESIRINDEEAAESAPSNAGGGAGPGPSSR